MAQINKAKATAGKQERIHLLNCLHWVGRMPGHITFGSVCCNLPVVHLLGFKTVRPTTVAARNDGLWQAEVLHARQNHGAPANLAAAHGMSQ